MQDHPQKPQDILPKQRSLTDDTPIVKPTPKWVIVCKKTLFWVLLTVAIVGVYVLLLIAEPTEEDKAIPKEDASSVISMPMTALESMGDADLQRLTDTYGGQSLTLRGQGITLTRTRLYDTAFQGGYARRMELTYDYNGQAIKAVSIRPASAAALMKDESYALTISKLYELDGKRSARMDSKDTICVFADVGTVSVALFVPASLEEELPTILAQTDLYYPTAANPS